STRARAAESDATNRSTWPSSDVRPTSAGRCVGPTPACGSTATFTFSARRAAPDQAGRQQPPRPRHRPRTNPAGSGNAAAQRFCRRRHRAGACPRVDANSPASGPARQLARHLGVTRAPTVAQPRLPFVVLIADLGLARIPLVEVDDRGPDPE